MRKIKVIGIGGAGGNAVSRLKKENFKKVDLIAINTDVGDLKKTKADFKLQIGKKVTKGLGAGMDPVLGRVSAFENKKEIISFLKGADLIFLTGGLGGGTFSGAGPIIGKWAKELGILTLAFPIFPFHFEGEKRKRIAQKALKELEEKTDALFLISNNKLAKVAQDKKVETAFRMGDEILKEAIFQISEIISTPQLINVDFPALCAILKNSGRGAISLGKGEGKERVTLAVKNTFSFPLLKVNLKNPKGVLFNIIGKDLKIAEIREVSNLVSKKISSQTKVIFGAKEDKKEEGLKIFLILAGLEK